MPGTVRGLPWWREPSDGSNGTAAFPNSSRFGWIPTPSPKQEQSIRMSMMSGLRSAAGLAEFLGEEAFLRLLNRV